MRSMILPVVLLLVSAVNAQAAVGLNQVQEVSPNFLTEMNGAVFFSAYDSAHGSALWRSNGTRGTTQVVKSFNTAGGTESNPVPQGLFNANGTLYFCAYETASGWELWKSDGSAAGTVMVKDLNPGAEDGVANMSCHLTNLGGQVFFGGIDAVHGAALWKTDGTAANTVLVQDLQPAGIWGIPEYLFVMGSTLYFVGNDGETGDEWWKCEGPAYSSATMVKDIWTAYRTGGAAVDGQRIPAVLNGSFYFQGNDGSSGYELWRSDGTEGGTARVKDIVGGAGSSEPRSFTVVNNTLFFVANDGVHGRELWTSDGTDGGTLLLKDIYTGSELYVEPSSLTEVNGILYFAADDGSRDGDPVDSSNKELWKSDGTEAGTVLVKDINPGPSSWPQYFTPFQGEIYFRASDGASGDELWKSDGTVGNATLVADIAPGSGSSWPVDFLVANNSLFFRATYDPGVPEGEGDALFRYGEWMSDFYWPMYLPIIINNAKKR